MFKTTSLTPQVKNIMLSQATESPEHICDINIKIGSYLCRNCGIKLFDGKNKFNSGTGWPSFDKPYANSVAEILDIDGIRTEIICSNCQGHLGHVFHDEQFTKQNVRYCVNSKALDFASETALVSTEEIIVAGGCFWGVEYYFDKLPGVVKTEVGYIGGNSNNPTYKQVCAKDSGHYEGVRILFDHQITTTEKILKYFFEIHDFTQDNGQGNDLGRQYLSRIFYHDFKQKLIAEKIISQLKDKNYQVQTQILPMQIFWPAEDDHQAYYQNNGGLPYCHFWQQIFG